jgi:hypothetical protein
MVPSFLERKKIEINLHVPAMNGTIGGVVTG